MLSKVHEKSAARYLPRYADEPRPAIIAFGNYLAPKSKTEPILISLLADIITDRGFSLCDSHIDLLASELYLVDAKGQHQTGDPYCHLSRALQ